LNCSQISCSFSSLAARSHSPNGTCTSCRWRPWIALATIANLVVQIVRQAMPEFAKKFDEEIKRAGIK
jgi:hypothetical protein